MHLPTNDAPDPPDPQGGEAGDAGSPQLSARLAALTPEQRRLLRRKLDQRRGRREAADPEGASQPSAGFTPVAIVGMACRLPGAETPEEFWRLIRRGGEAVRPIPPDRWDQRRFFDPTGRSPGKMSVDAMAAVDGIDQFDPAFFGIAPREAAKMDPQQRLLLEVTWEAFENAGIPVDSLAGSDTGVFVGIGGTDYSKVPARYPNYFDQVDAYSGTGNALSIASGRISYLLDFRGPSFVVDTACSSGMVAIHSAAVSLARGECRAAVAGGVNLIMSPETTIAFSKAQMLSPDGHCRPFDASANGYVRGEGCGIVLLKRLGDAVREGDQILGILRGSAVNQDGRTSGITAPSGVAQQQVIARAMRAAGVTPNDLTYLEAHGTGTPLGDPIELTALAESFARRSTGLPPLHIGSVKASIGHTETVSGVAGLLKVLLMFAEGEIPKQPNFCELNPNARLPRDLLRVPRDSRPWLPLADGRRIAGVSSFGFGGTNAHLVVEHPDAARPAVARGGEGHATSIIRVTSDTPAAELEDPETGADEAPESPSAAEPRILCLPLSARQPAALAELAGRMGGRLVSADLRQAYDVCGTAALGRMGLPIRAAVVAQSPESLRQRLVDLEAGRTNPDIVTGRVPAGRRSRIAMLFTGQGSQHAGMAQTLGRDIPRFAESLGRAAEILDPVLPLPLSEILAGGSDSAPLDHTACAQPAIVAVECALADTFADVGIRPHVVAGHSIGEIAALYAAGGLEHEQALLIAAHRGATMGALPGGGKMAALLTGAETAQCLINETDGEAAIAAMNGPASTVVSGRAETVEQVVAQAQRRDIPFRMLNVSHAFHSPLMKPAAEPLRQRLRKIVGAVRWDSDIKFVSSVTGCVHREPIDIDYWIEHLLRPVRFTDVMDWLREQTLDLAIEVGPGSQLCGMVRRAEAAMPTGQTTAGFDTVPALEKDGRDEYHWTKAIAGAWSVGVPVDWKRFYSRYRWRRAPLPNYPFQRERYWYDPPAAGGAGDFGPLAHPLLGTRQELATGGAVFHNTFREHDPPYLRDHMVGGSVTVPAAAWIEMFRAAAARELGTAHVELKQFQIERPVFITSGESVTVQTIAGSSSGGSCRLQVSVKIGDSDAPWQRCASCVARTSEDSTVPRAKLAPPGPRSTRLEAETLYGELAEAGLEYGELFRTVRGVRTETGAATGELMLAPSLQSGREDTAFHPTLIDGALQLIAAIATGDDEQAVRDTYLPVGVACCRFGDGGRVHTAVARRSDDLDGQIGQRRTHEIIADVELFDEDGRWVAALDSVRLTRLRREANAGDLPDASRWLYRITWESVDRQRGTSVDGESSETAERLPARFFGDTRLDACRRTDHRVHASGGDTGSGTDAAPGSFARREHWIWVQPKVGEEGADGESVGAVSPGAVAAATENLLTTLQSALSQNVTPRVSVLTCHAFAVAGGGPAVDPIASAVIGLARVAAIEHPQLELRILDTDPCEDASPEAISGWLEDGSDETEMAVRGGQWYVPRLKPESRMLSRRGEAAELPIPPGGSYRVRLDGTDRIDGLWVERIAAPVPADGEVLVDVRATGLNFSDVLKTMGLYPGVHDAVVPLGIEVCGRVLSTGPSVGGLHEGTRVMGIVPYGFASEATTHASLLVPVPPSLSDEEAATIPIVFLTAHHALLRVGRLMAGERVLIHAGAGGVGLAAIQIARSVGATVYTTAGQPAKRRLLEELGVEPENIFDSRDLRSLDRIHRRTGGRGVDVVLNSLPGDWIDASLKLLAAHGRFLEIGKTDIYQDRPIGLAPFQDNLTFSAIDLDRLLRERREEAHQLFLEVAERFRDGTYTPLPLTQFRLDELPSAMRFMAARRNIGKIVVSTPPSNARKFDVPGTHLITGGSGAIARGAAKRLIARGARDIALVARSDPPEDFESLRRLADNSGAKLHYFQADCADERAMRDIVARLQQDGRPVVGVIHAAGLLDDRLLHELTADTLAKVLRPKVDGAITLDRVTVDQPIAYFAMLGSIASVFGSPGQGNYAAANGFLEGFAADRRRRGLPASIIHWGPWGASANASGMAGELRKQRNLEARGLRPLPFDTAVELLLDAVLQDDTDGGVIVDATWGRMLSATEEVPSIFRHLDRESEAAGTSAAAASRDETLLAELAPLDPDSASRRLTEFFAIQLGRIMSLSPESIDADTPLGTLGLDSLMAIELKNTIEAQLGISLPISRFIDDPNLHDLASAAAEALESDQTAAPATTDGGGDR